MRTKYYSILKNWEQSEPNFLEQNDTPVSPPPLILGKLRLGNKKCEFTVTRPTLTLAPTPKVFIALSKDNYFHKHIFTFKQCFQHVWDRYSGNKGVVLTHEW